MEERATNDLMTMVSSYPVINGSLPGSEPLMLMKCHNCSDQWEGVLRNQNLVFKFTARTRELSLEGGFLVE